MNITFDSDDKHHQQIEIKTIDPIQSTYVISHQDVDIQLTSRTNLLTDTTPINDVNQVFSQPIIDHNWDLRYYSGHLVTTYDQYVAYALKRQSGDDIVCVFYKQVDYRSVINPPFTGDIHDIAFSYSDDVLLACVDQASHLRIYRIEKSDEPNELQHSLILFLDLQYSNPQAPSTISWCCFIPEADETDVYNIMSITRGSQVEVLNIPIAAQSCLSEDKLSLNQIENGRLTYVDNNGNVTCVCFSPDGTALGTGTDKGEIKFFSINFEQPNKCRCLHLWIPHEGRPISSLYFLDDHKNLTLETQLWRYAVSGCEQNREFKVWSCTNWTCLQTIRFQYSSAQYPVLKSAIDLTSRFLVLSDINASTMYVLTIYQDADNNRAHFSSINAFTSVNSPSLSFDITSTNQINCNDQSEIVSYGVKMYSIHTKYFQELLLIFRTNRFMTINPEYYEQDELIEDFRFEPYISHLRNEDRSILKNAAKSDSNFRYNINDLLTPDIDKPSAASDPLHGLLLGNTTAFDSVSSQQEPGDSNDLPSPYDLADKEVADSLYPLQFEGIPNDDVDAVFLPIKSNEDEPLKGINVSNNQDLDDYSDQTETSDKDDDSTADEGLVHPRIKRRQGRSPNSSQIGLNVDSLHEIRQLTSLLTDVQRNSRAQASQQGKLEQCCQRLEQLSTKVDRLMNFDQTGTITRPSRPSPNAAPVEIVPTSDIPTTLSDVNYDQLEAILIEKIQTYLQTAMKSVFEPYREMKDNLHKDLAAKLLATDTVIKQTITQLFRSKTMIDSLSSLISQAIQSTMTNTYREAFNQTVIPSFERAVTNMFQQTNDVFKRGTKEFLQEMIEYSRQQQRSLIQQRDQMLGDIRKESTQLHKEIDKKHQELVGLLKTDITQYLTANLTAIVREITRSILRDEINSIFRDLLNTQKTEITNLLRQTVVPASRTTTPLPTQSLTLDAKQEHVLKLIRAKQYNQAFEFALSASDLNLVLYVCENIRITELFAVQPCPLQIPVLLSLIQQLAAELTTHQETKYSYLYEALICLDVTHPSVRDYLQNVLVDLNKKLQTYIQTHPTTTMAKRFQLLLMASQGLLQKIIQQRTTTPSTFK